MNGLLTADERCVVGAAHQLSLILSSQWPDVAAHLLAQGGEGDAITELAGLPRTASAWLVDQLVPPALSELAVPELPAAALPELARRLLGQAAAIRDDADEFATIRALASLSPTLGYPGGIIGDAYYAAEWLDCVCHADSPELDAAVALETTLRAGRPLHVDRALLLALTVDRVVT